MSRDGGESVSQSLTPAACAQSVPQTVAAAVYCAVMLSYQCQQVPRRNKPIPIHVIHLKHRLHPLLHARLLMERVDRLHERVERDLLGALWVEQCDDAVAEWVHGEFGDEVEVLGGDEADALAV